MRVSETTRKRRDFFDKLKKTLGRWCNSVAEVLARPIEWFDKRYDQYGKGLADGSEKTMDCMLRYIRIRCNTINERCNWIEAVISDIEIRYPELHTEVDSIESSIREIREQVK